ncbi:thiazole synthase [Paenibacillus turpanensis]|uniref:thiazole synthase n=1 Tax=Paenibacillus turpanensis TaxID=2689078 RepID=UPI00140B6201|nr:thiazole synthase [Paenibacillus turpanensis]
MEDVFVIGGVELSSRLFVGTGKFGRESLISDVIHCSGSQVVTVALRRVNLQSPQNQVIASIPKGVQLLPNTSGARNALEAIRIARLAKEAGLGNWIKIEVIPDQTYLLPDNEETIKATAILAKEGFHVFPYMNPDLIAAQRMQEAGAAAVMPLGAPIGSNRGLQTKEMIRILLEEIEVPIIVDAGIGKPSEAADAMEMGAAAVLVNTAIASAKHPALMAEAFASAVHAGRLAYCSGLGMVRETASASSPLTGFLG